MQQTGECLSKLTQVPSWLVQNLSPKYLAAPSCGFHIVTILTSIILEVDFYFQQGMQKIKKQKCNLEYIKAI